MNLEVMDLSKVARKIQYQVAKLEVIESLFELTYKNQPILEIEIGYKMFCSIRENLFNYTEACISVFPGYEVTAINSLQNNLISANNFLVEYSNGVDSSPSTLFLKSLLNDIVSKLLSLNNELTNALTYFQELESFENDNAASDGIAELLSEMDSLFKKLVTKCLGDSEKAERLIQYEFQRSPKFSRKEAIQAAIYRWENDNR